MAKVTVVVASVIQVRFFINSSVRKRLGTTKRMARKLMSVAMMAKKMVKASTPKIVRLFHCERALGWYFFFTVRTIVFQKRCQFVTMLK